MPGNLLKRDSTFWFLLALAHIICVNILSRYMLTYYPNTGDEFAILFQSKIFSLFSLTGDAPPLLEGFRSHYLAVKNGKWFSQYPPVYPLMLLPGTLIGNPLLMVSLLSGGMIFSLCALLGKVFGEQRRKEILIFGLFFAFSPTVLFHSASYYSHIGALLIYSLALHAFFVWYDRRETKSLVWLSVCFGLGVGIRPFTFFLLSLPLGVFLLCQKEVRKSGKSLSAIIAPFTALLIILVCYNFNQTGSWTELSYLKAGKNEVKLSLSNISGASFIRLVEMIDETSKWLFGSGFFASGSLKDSFPQDFNIGLFLFVFSLSALPFLSQNSYSKEKLFFRIAFASSLAVLLGHVFYNFQGGRFGERFFFEVTWFVLAGLIFAMKSLSDSIKSKVAPVVTYGLYGLLIFSSLGLYIPATVKVIRESNLKRMDPFIKTEGDQYQNAVVHLSYVPDYDTSFYTRNNPDLSGRIFLNFSGNLSKSFAQFKDRKHYFYIYDRQLNKSKIIPIERKN